MEEEVFPHPAVRRILKEKFVEARLHTDHPSLGEKWIALESQSSWVGYHAQSTYVVIDPKTRAVVRWSEFKTDFKSDPNTFAAWLEGK